MANPKIVFDAFVKNVKPDPKSTDPVVYLNGYIGESPIDDGHIRVYTDAQLSNYVDIPKSSILHAEQNSKEENPLGGSKLWIRYGGLTGQAAASAGGFLEGDVYANYAAKMYQPGTQAAEARAFGAPINPLPQSVFNCPSRIIACASAGVICRTYLNATCPMVCTINPNICGIGCWFGTKTCVRRTTIPDIPVCRFGSRTFPTDPTDIFDTIVNPGIGGGFDIGGFNPHVHGF